MYRVGVYNYNLNYVSRKVFFLFFWQSRCFYFVLVGFNASWVYMSGNLAVLHKRKCMEGRVCHVCVCVCVCLNLLMEQVCLEPKAGWKKLLHLFFLWKLIWEPLDPSGSELYSQACRRTCWCLCKIVPCCSFCHLRLWHNTAAVMALASISGWVMTAMSPCVCVNVCVCVRERRFGKVARTQRHGLDGKVVISETEGYKVCSCGCWHRDSGQCLFSSMAPILVWLPADSPLWHNITSLQLACRFEGVLETWALRQTLLQVHREGLTIREVGGCNSGRVMDYIRAVNRPLKAN